MKRCQKCRVPKDEKEFSWRWNALGKRDDICKECRKVYNDQYFKGEARERHLEQVRERKQAAREYVLNYLATHPCETCGESDVRVLEFHHTGEKEKTVSHMVGEGYAIERIQAEIDKCTILRLLRTTNGVECLHREVRR